MLTRLGVRSIGDLLLLAPRQYQDLTEVQSVVDLEDGQLVRLAGTVIERDERSSRAGRNVFGALVRCAGGNVRAVWFNQPWIKDKIATGQQVLLTGRAQFKGGIWQLVHPQVQQIEADAGQRPAIVPVYPLTEGLAQPAVRRIVQNALEETLAEVVEALPAELSAARGLPGRRQALAHLHAPPDREALEQAQRRLAYEELLLLQLALAVRHHQHHERGRAVPLETTAKIDSRIRNLFPFPFTAGQNAAIEQVRADLARPHPMNRLLQGDVGSGKTVVALYAVLTAVAQRHQAAILAPTEILARQHADTLGQVLSSSRVRWECLTGGAAAEKRREVLARLADGSLDAVIGTHAILQQDVRFARLALLVIDEQHKFGVRQRARLRQGDIDPHTLVMTATPIPRTMALALYGDLDVSTITDTPPGRQTVHTYLVSPEQAAAWWDFARRKLREGRQMFVVTPHIEADEDLAPEEADGDAPAAVSLDETYERLVNGPLAEFRVGLVHGRLSAKQKDAAMADFRAGRTQALVCTTVVEVGIDVPNATLLVIEGAERFGLSQLHQLRGRVARGTHPGFCAVFGSPRSDRARERLEAFAATGDGFKLAELDFALRGPGELLGTRQHGLPPLTFADLRHDGELLEVTRDDARALVAQDPGLAQPRHTALRRAMIERYGAALDLGDVG